MASIANLIVAMTADTGQFQTDMARASRATKAELAKMKREADAFEKKLVSSFKVAGAAVAAGLVAATKSALEFNKAMTEVSTLLSNTDGLDNLSDAVKALSVEYAQAPVDQARALYQIISAGASDATTQIELLTAANKLAVGGVTNVATAADGLTTVLNAYAGTGLDAGRASDILFTTMKNGKTTIDELSSTVGKVATIAAQTGVSFEELGAAVGTITKAGIGTSEAMSAVRGVLAAVLQQSEKSQKAAKELGIEFSVAALQAKGLAGFLKDIGDSGATASQLQQLFGQIEGLTAVMAIGSNNAAEFTAQLEAQARASENGGATAEALGRVMDEAAFKAEQASAAIKVLGIEIGQRFLAAVSGVATTFVKNLDGIQTAIESLAAVVVARVGVAMVAAFNGAAVAARSLATAIAFVGGPVGLLATGVALLVVNWDSLIRRQDVIGDFSRQLSRGFTILLGVIKAVAAELLNLAQIAVNITQVVGAPITALVRQWEAAAKAIQSGDLKGAVVGIGLLAQQSGRDAAAAFENLKQNIREVGDSSKYMTEAWLESAAAFSSGGVASGVRELEEAASKFLKMAADARAEANRFAKSLTSVGAEAKSGAKDIDVLEKAAQGFIKTFQNSKKEVEKHTRALEESARAQIEYAEAVQDFIDIGDPVGAMVRDFSRQVEFANKALADGKITADQYRATLNALSNQLGQTAASMQQTAQQSGTMTEAMLEGVRILERVFTDMWSNIGQAGNDVFDSLLDGFKSFMGNMIHQLTTGKVVEQLRNLFDPNKIFDFKEFATGLAGAAGVFAGGILGGGGERANLGAQLGGLIGSFVGPLGTAIGGILGGLLGGLFDKDRPAVLQVSSFDTSRQSKSDTDSIVDTAFGRTFIRTRRLDEAAINSFKEALAAFDNSIGSFLDESQITKIAGALEGWSKQIEGETLSAEQLLNSRFTVILSTFSDDLQQFVNKAQTLEEQVARLQIGVGAEKLFADQPDLFGNRTVQEFLAVVDAFKGGTESIADAFQRVVELLDTVLAVKSSLAEFASSDLAGDFNLLLERQAESVVQTVTRMTNDLADAVFSFDGSPEQLVQIGNLALSVRQEELNALSLIESVSKGLNANLDRLRKDTEATINGPRAAEDILFDARALIGTVSTAQTPEEIAQIGQQFEELIRSLSPEDTKAFGTSTLAIIDAFKAASQASLDRAERAILDSGEAIRNLVEGFGDLIDPLELVAATNERAAAALELIAGVTNANTTEPESYEEQARIISDGIDGALSSGVDRMSVQLVNAVRQGFAGASMNPTIVVRDRGLVTN